MGTQALTSKCPVPIPRDHLAPWRGRRSSPRWQSPGRSRFKGGLLEFPWPRSISPSKTAGRLLTLAASPHPGRAPPPRAIPGIERWVWEEATASGSSRAATQPGGARCSNPSTSAQLLLQSQPHLPPMVPLGHPCQWQDKGAGQHGTSCVLPQIPACPSRKPRTFPSPDPAHSWALWAPAEALPRPQLWLLSAKKETWMQGDGFQAGY